MRSSLKCVTAVTTLSKRILEVVAQGSKRFFICTRKQLASQAHDRPQKNAAEAKLTPLACYPASSLSFGSSLVVSFTAEVEVILASSSLLAHFLTRSDFTFTNAKRDVSVTQQLRHFFYNGLICLNEQDRPNNHPPFPFPLTP